MQAASHLYLIALGSNQRHQLLGRPGAILLHAMEALETADIDVFSTSAVIRSYPIGPSRREYANAAALLVSRLEPPELLAELHRIEEHFGRIRRGSKWRARILDLDIILWSGGIWASDVPPLAIPHPHFKSRAFVLSTAAEIAPDMRDPLSGRSIRQLQYQNLQPKPLDRSAQPA